MSEHLPRTITLQLLAQAQQQSDIEVCGLIAARDDTPHRLIPIDNIAPHPETLFEMDPKQQIEAMRELREQDETLWAIYHSHPHAPAVPSATDLENASYPDALYLVVSLNTEGVMEVAGFRLSDGSFEPVSLEISDY